MRWPYVAAGLAFLLASPHLAWQVSHDWPTLEFIHRATAFKNVQQSPLGFLAGVAFEGNPFFVPAWLVAGFFGLFARERDGHHRWAAWLSFAVVAFLACTGSAKPYYADPALLPLCALFGLALERWGRKAWVRASTWSYIVAFGLFTLPFALAVLSVEHLVAYRDATSIGIKPPAAERSRQARLPQFFADRFGWKALAEAVQSAHAQLAPAERNSAVIFCQNYGQAASLEYHAARYKLPRVVSAHNSYWLWGPGDAEATVWIVVGDNRERLESIFDSVDLSTTKRCRECMPFENDLPIWIGRGMKTKTRNVWRKIENFI